MYGYRGILLIRMHRILLKTARQGSPGNIAQRNNSDFQWRLPAEYGKNIANKRPRDGLLRLPGVRLTKRPWEAEETMFYKMIERARDRWYASPDCTIGNIIDYMTRQGNLRDAQIGAIKTYLFLKICCENKPLATLFC